MPGVCLPLNLYVIRQQSIYKKEIGIGSYWQREKAHVRVRQISWIRREHIIVIINTDAHGARTLMTCANRQEGKIQVKFVITTRSKRSSLRILLYLFIGTRMSQECAKTYAVRGDCFFLFVCLHLCGMHK